MQYFEDDDQLTDILITGGDALMSRNKTLKKILDAVLKMATLKELQKSLGWGADYQLIYQLELILNLLKYLVALKMMPLKLVLSNLLSNPFSISIRNYSRGSYCY